VDGGTNNYTFTGNETIHQAAWVSLPDGIVSIRFYANNSLGDLYFKQVIVKKDTSAPNITINDPLENEIFGVFAPNFIAEISDPNLDSMWYSISNSTYNSLNITFMLNGTINPAEWGILYDGVYTIKFFANDTLGNFNSQQLNVIKDGSAPIISIISPVLNEEFGVTAPSFNIDILDSNLDTMWYTVNNSPTLFFFVQDGTIDQTIWDAQTNGEIIIIFYANDTLGNLASEDIIIRKSIPSEPPPDIILIIILASIIGGVAAVGVAVVILIKKGKISLKKFSIKKTLSEKTKPEEVPKEETLAGKNPTEAEIEIEIGTETETETEKKE
jgi:hypothetical protein